ncbi:serine/threonine-protein kinase-like protein CCR4 [Brachypodium distachyon]|uniref:Protein kinase domain-containing protein n=1 Tax=Brachypodium distachyon TaxID=15368 RepID=I1IXZ8_BRADI|nr:serine/threonine-protein kinase-like protein CCR4 [Brachypodium distachyon]KQJ82756.2 hypothetical protein BRADI_5g10787v3 [Brachypodium distachyon]|eukprot:XP_003581257.1 serine/threonine-protein kinase-like protein CCR4 [Brachypodium distachyon]
MSPKFPPSPLTFFFALVVLALPSLAAASSSFALPTIAIAAVGANTTSPHHLACGLVSTGTDYHLSCASVSNRSASPHEYGHGEGRGGASTTPFSAVVAGDGYVCSVGPTSSNPESMRWWDLADEEKPSKRVYRGAELSAVAGGGEYVCGLVETRIQCWRWPWAPLPKDVGFTAVALGGGFVCGLVVGTGEVKCYGDGDAVGREPRGRYMLLAAGERHACAVDDAGMLDCWGEAAAVAAAAPPRLVRSVSTVAVGDGVTCVLWGNWTASCWPEAEAAPPQAMAQRQFVALEAKGKVVCGVLMSDYSMVCWGGDVAGGLSKVFDKVLPGPCAPSGSCPCGVWSGSAALCGDSTGYGAAICYPCGYTPPMMLQVPSTSQSTGKKQRPISDLAIALICVGIGSGLGTLLAALSVAYCLRQRSGSGRSSSHGSGRIHAEPTSATIPAPPRVPRRLSALLSKGPNTTVEQFPLAALRAATGVFSPSHRIGSGSFGAVYRASLPDGREVAIKRAERRDTGGASSSAAAAAARRVNHESAFVSELSLLSRLNHKNLVRLLGFCADGGEHILVYEFMPNGTLHDHLHKRPAPLSPPLASWPARLRLALGAARGIEYLHTYAVPPIIHRDIKSSNILLDATWSAKVADFGLSLLNNSSNAGDNNEPLVTAGTVGYMDPEYYRLQHLTDKSDVYSFGVLLLELLSGCKVIQRYEGSGTPRNVVDMAVPYIESDRVHRVLDIRLPLPTPGEMEAVAYVGYLAADCVRLPGRDRPSMSEAVGVLERAVAACEDDEDGADEAALSRSCTDGSATM